MRSKHYDARLATKLRLLCRGFDQPGQTTSGSVDPLRSMLSHVKLWRKSSMSCPTNCDVEGSRDISDVSACQKTQRFLDSHRNDQGQQPTRALFAHLIIHYDEPPHSAAMNMSIDHALLESTTIPTIRFYHWRSPALSFGYFGKFSHVAVYAAKRNLVRRWTGGGIVLHGDDLTYSIIIPASDQIGRASCRER